MAETALSTKDDDIEIMDIMPMMIMVMLLALIPTMISPITKQLQAQAYQEAQAYEGKIDSRTLRATDELQFINLVDNPPYSPWISAFVINDGPNAVKVGINRPSPFLNILKDETRTIVNTNADRRIEDIYYQCDPGETASVRFEGQY